MPILYAIPARHQTRTGVSQSRHLGRWLWRRLGCSLYPSFPIPSLHNGNEWLQPPVNCRPLVTRLKWTAGSTPNLQPQTAPGQVEELKKRFPMLQIRIYEAHTNAREEI